MDSYPYPYPSTSISKHLFSFLLLSITSTVTGSPEHDYPFNPATAPAVVTVPIQGNTMISGSSSSWCVAMNGVKEEALQAGLDYACGIGGVDCSSIQTGANCFNPDNMQSHASFAFNLYYQKNPVPSSCDFGGTAIITNLNPSFGSCIFTTSSQSIASPGIGYPITVNPQPNPATTVNPQPNPATTVNPQPNPATTVNPQPNPATTVNPQPNPATTVNPQPNPATTVNPQPTPTTEPSSGAAASIGDSGALPTLMNITNPANGDNMNSYGGSPPTGSNSLPVSASTIILEPLTAFKFIVWGMTVFAARID